MRTGETVLGEQAMYRIIKVLNNNGVLVLDDVSGREMIFLGSGIGFGHRTGERIAQTGKAKRYELVSGKTSALQRVNELNPLFIEAAGRVIEEAEKSLGPLDDDILIPLADHIALSVSRAAQNREFTNPFRQDIETLFGREYSAALRGREALTALTGIRISDDEVGFLTLHIHAGMSEENVAESLEMARLVQDCVRQIEEGIGARLAPESLGYNRLVSHLRYLVERVRRGERANLDLDDYARTNFPDSYALAERICGWMERQLKREMAREETGYLAIHIQRVR